MPLALMVPCDFDMFCPRVGIATLQLGIDVIYPKDQTCCSTIRVLNMASMSERVRDPVFSKPRALVSGV
jgi:hypothetical protein